VSAWLSLSDAVLGTFFPNTKEKRRRAFSLDAVLGTLISVTF